MDCGCGEAFRHLSVETREYMWQILNAGHTEWLGEVEPLLETTIDGDRIYAVHAAPSDPLFKYIPPDTPDEELAREAALAAADIILMGHTHKPFMKEIGGKLLVNVGSVGQPRDGIPKASYAVIEDGRVELRRAEYDVERTVARVMEMPIDKLAREQLAYILEHADTPPTKPEDDFLPQCKCL
jgi:diadenosine tetraphosphatase ApaH/serine/threonine PP2A family protein phosphatase